MFLSLLFDILLVFMPDFMDVCLDVIQIDIIEFLDLHFGKMVAIHSIVAAIIMFKLKKKGFSCIG